MPTPLQDAWGVLSLYAAQSSLAPNDVAVVAAQSFWDYASQIDYNLPGVSVGGNCSCCSAEQACFGHRNVLQYTVHLYLP